MINFKNLERIFNTSTNQETFNDLRKPSAWASYSKGLAIESSKAVKGRISKGTAKGEEKGTFDTGKRGRG